MIRWLIKLVQQGTKKQLEISDLYETLDKDNSKKLGDCLEGHWKAEILKSQIKKTSPSLLKAIIKAFYFEFLIYGLVWFILNVVLRCSQPIILFRFIALFSGENREKNQEEMYTYGGLLILVSVLSIFFMHHLQIGLASIGMRIRVACSSLVYRKITKLSHKSLGQTAVGQVVNLLSNDVHRFDLVLLPLHAFWAIPFQFVILSYFIWQQVQIASLAGLFSMVIVSLPVQGYLGQLMGNFRANIAKKTDNRVKLMSEIISGIQVIKMYAWEKPFEKVIEIARKKEIRCVTHTSYLRGIFASCMVFMERMSLCFTLICYVLLGNNITAEKVFSLAQAFNILQLSMAIWYPLAVSHGAEALISIKRLKTFLMLEEKEVNHIKELSTPGVVMSNVSSSWSDSGETLQDISLKIPPGFLCVVIGPLGAGKSSLLQLLLGELAIKTGMVQMGGEISYCSQEPWLFQSTIRNNILFGRSFDKQLYEKVVKVCALERDFQQFPERDKTVVGERGVSLSGGQRARINLARAIYRQADVYLLDDPLSAVDTHVGKHLFNQCIVKHLRGKTRILVTHQLQYLKKANLIVVLNQGKIETVGTFEQLSRSKLDFAKIIVDSVEPGDKQEEIIESSDLTNTVSKSRKASVASTKSDLSDSLEYFQEDNLNNEEIEHDQQNAAWKEYFRATRRTGLLIVVFGMLVLAQTICSATDLWVAFWTNQEEIRHSSSIALETDLTTSDKPILYEANPFNISSNVTTNYVYKVEEPYYVISDGIFDYVHIKNNVYHLLKTSYAMSFYGFLIVGVVILTLFRSMMFVKVCMIASVNIHSKMFSTLLRAPIRFFDTNASGRILNRFSKDMGSIDEILPRVLLESVQIFLVLIGILVNVSISSPYAIIAMLFLGIFFLKLRSWYLSIAISLKHIEGKVKSPVFSHVNSSLNGMSTIRASKTEDILIKEFDEHQNVHTSAWYLTLVCISAFGLWMDIICIVFLTCVILSFIFLQGFFEVNGSLVGLAISQSMTLTGMLQYGMKQTAEVINQLTAVERVLQYTHINTEGPFESPIETRPVEPWPKFGRVDYKHVYLKYSEDNPPVLRNLQFTILPGQKVGIVGRTGAGKSSLVAALFRLVNFQGTILIDGIDTKRMGLTYLRKKISIIPQEPVLFSATLRNNLDPFEEFTDEQIWKALDQVELKELSHSLDLMICEGGSNFSLGQRQLICLARAVLRNNNILVLDEATANVDHRTDSLIQTTIRNKFKDYTVITIAHRLNTIMDYDKVIVMSYGRMVEFGHPHQLLQVPDGHFHRMVLETGPVMSLQLKDVAMLAYSNILKLEVASTS
ncbi:ATP-binding cassette sub-family C member 4-like isoform X2 [Diabrotica undecimpunctata]|uniref:ATP-binding cassette sub-family C member 4-like isoform X2 n=1 Tax=Diabrotica undecimpunctata TaxID=50387 RepID=UPI003B64196D